MRSETQATPAVKRGSFTTGPVYLSREEEVLRNLKRGCDLQETNAAVRCFLGFSNIMCSCLMFLRCCLIPTPYLPLRAAFFVLIRIGEQTVPNLIVHLSNPVKLLNSTANILSAELICLTLKTQQQIKPL